MIRFIKQLFHARPVFSNTAEGVHPGRITRTLKSNVAVRHLLGKTGGTASQVSVCSADENPIGVITDAGEVGDLVNISLLGTAPCTALMVASEAISAGDTLYTAADGKVQGKPSTPGTYYQVGRALTAAAGEDALIEVDPCSARKTVVADAFSGNATADISSLAGILEEGPDKVIMLPEHVVVYNYKTIHPAYTMNTEKMNTPRSGEISAANENRFDATHYSEPLTAFTVGWKDPENLDGLLDFVAPRVHVGRRFEFKRATNAEAFFSESDDVRAIGSAFKRVEYSGDTVNAKTLNKGLTMRVDHDEVYGDDWQESYVQILLQRLLRNELRRAIVALDAAAASSAHTWDETGTPDADIRAALIDATDESGVRPNRLLFGESAWDLRAAAYEAQDNAGAFRSLALDPQSLARKLFVEGVRIAGARYQSSASEKSGLVGNAVYAFFEQNAVTKDEPSNLKRFVTPVDGGGNFRVYLEESAKFTDLTVEHYSNVIATSDLGVRKLAVSVS